MHLHLLLFYSAVTMARRYECKLPGAVCSRRLDGAKQRFSFLEGNENATEPRHRGNVASHPRCSHRRIENGWGVFGTKAFVFASKKMKK